MPSSASKIFFSHEATLNQLSDALHTNGRRALVDSDIRSVGGNNGHFTGNVACKYSSLERTEDLQVAPHSLGPSKWGAPQHRGDTRPDPKVTVPSRPPTLLSSPHGPYDAGGALGGVLGLSPSGELLPEDTLPEPDSLESQVPALPARRTWRLDGTDRRMSDDEEVPIERNAVERNRTNKIDGLRMPLESGLSSSLRAARGGLLDRDITITEDDRENTEADSGVLNSFTPRLPNVSSDRVLSPNLAKERTTSSTNSLMWKLRLGIPQTQSPTEDRNERNMKYIHIPERGREQFQQFAKALKDKLSVECAESNPYVKALCAHRQEMADSGLDLGKEAVDSLPARLATERYDALASMEMSEEFLRERQHCDLYCHRSHCEARHRWDMMELPVPEMEERIRRRNGGALVPTHLASSSDRSTAVASHRSDLKARRVVFPNTSQASSDEASLSLRIGRNRLELSEDDRMDFLSAIGCKPPGGSPVTSTPSNVSIPKEPVRASVGDISPSPRIDDD